MAENKVLDIKTIVEQAKKYDEILPYTLKNGEDMEFYPHFSRTKIKEIIAEFQEYMASENKEDKKFMEVVTQDEVSTMLFWYFLAIKKFTHFGEQMKRLKTARGLAPYYNALLETGLLEEIVNDVFIYEEVKKINDMFATEVATMGAAMEIMNTYEEQLKKAQNKFKEETIKNKVIEDK